MDNLKEKTMPKKSDTVSSNAFRKVNDEKRLLTNALFDVLKDANVHFILSKSQNIFNASLDLTVVYMGFQEVILVENGEVQVFKVQDFLHSPQQGLIELKSMLRMETVTFLHPDLAAARLRAANWVIQRQLQTGSPFEVGDEFTCRCSDPSHVHKSCIDCTLSRVGPLAPVEK